MRINFDGFAAMMLGVAVALFGAGAGTGYWVGATPEVVYEPNPVCAVGVQTLYCHPGPAGCNWVDGGNSPWTFPAVFCAACAKPDAGFTW